MRKEYSFPIKTKVIWVTGSDESSESLFMSCDPEVITRGYCSMNQKEKCFQP